MTHVSMISMDATLFTGTIGDSRTRHLDYAHRIGSLDVTVCTRGTYPPIETPELRVRATGTSWRPLYLTDGYQIATQLAADKHPQVIATQDPFLAGLVGLRLRRKLGVPLIVQIHTSVIENPFFAQESRQQRFLQFIARQVVRRADVIRVVNSNEKAACIRLGIPEERIHVIPVTTDLTHFSQPDTSIDWRARLDLNQSDRVALWVGRPVPVKNLPLLLNAFALVAAQMPEARLVLAGAVEGTPIPALITKLGLQNVVRTPGAIVHAELPSLYQSADVYVHSSWYEGLGLVQIEAEAAGLPVISTRTDGALDVIWDHETGLLVDWKADALAAALIELLGDPERARSMGQAGRADVLARFDREQLIARWVGLWESTAASGSESDTHSRSSEPS